MFNAGIKFVSTILPFCWTRDEKKRDRLNNVFKRIKLKWYIIGMASAKKHLRRDCSRARYFRVNCIVYQQKSSSSIRIKFIKMFGGIFVYLCWFGWWFFARCAIEFDLKGLICSSNWMCPFVLNSDANNESRLNGLMLMNAALRRQARMRRELSRFSLNSHRLEHPLDIITRITVPRLALATA